MNFLSKQYSGDPDGKNIGIDVPAGAITCRDHHAFITAYMGSGSSRIAAYRAGLDYYGCEIDEGYFRDAQERFDRICLGTVHADGATIKQGNIFEQ